MFSIEDFITKGELALAEAAALAATEDELRWYRVRELALVAREYLHEASLLAEQIGLGRRLKRALSDVFGELLRLYRECEDKISGLIAKHVPNPQTA